ncbi:MAG: hypothetical protein LBQ49_01820 [Rickettsiales bacterium]|jgi:hypothetical protein|nr:hypothetical protein [Rickettsiales bacterium]
MKKLLLTVVFGLLTSCGFAPMYSNNRALQAELSDIYIAPIVGTNGIDLRNHLIQSWNTPNVEGAKYSLVVAIKEPVTIYKGLLRSGDATWEEVRMTASWTLSTEGKVIARADETASESYTFVSDLVSANASKINAVQNVIRTIGEKIELKVNAKVKNL